MVFVKFLQNFNAPEHCIIKRTIADAKRIIIFLNFEVIFSIFITYKLVLCKYVNARDQQIRALTLRYRLLRREIRSGEYSRGANGAASSK